MAAAAGLWACGQTQSPKTTKHTSHDLAAGMRLGRYSVVAPADPDLRMCRRRPFWRLPGPRGKPPAARAARRRA